MLASRSLLFSPRARLGRETIDPHCRIAQDRVAMARVRFDGVEIGVDEIAIAGPQLLDWKIRTEQAAIGPEDRHRLRDDAGDVRRVIAMDERAQPGELADDVRTRRQPYHAGAPDRATGGGQVLQHSGMLQHECDFRTGFGKAGCVRHLRRKHLQIEAPVVVGQPRHVAANRRIRAQIGARGEPVERAFVPVQLHTYATHQWVMLQPVELRADVVRAEMRIGDDRMRPAGFLGGALHPGRLVLEPRRRPIGLHVDRFDDTMAGEVVEIFADRIVATDRLVGTEYARLHRPDQPGKIGLAPDVMMRIDNADHAALLCRSESTCATTAALDPPSTMSSTKRRMAISASVCGTKRGPTASGVSQLMRQARRESLATASRKAERSPRSRPSDRITTTAPRA